MEKKPGQISANTLNLRFMKDAARARQEREVEEAKAKVRTEEEWELAPELRESWEGQVDDQTVSYEPSYLPFLFPGLARSSNRTTIPVADTAAQPDDAHEDGDSCDEAVPTKYRGRRKFGKHGKEAVEAKPMPAPPPPPPEVVLPHGFRGISSHGRAAASALKKRAPRRPPPRAMTPPPLFIADVYVPPPPKPQGFMKPPVDAPRAPRAIATRKRRSTEGGASEFSAGGRTDEMDNRNGKKKRMNE